MLNKPLDMWSELDFLRRAYVYARDHSDDPSTQNGAVLVPAGSQSNQVLFGANHFPDKVKVTSERLADRNIKLVYMEHAEREVIFKAARNGIPTEGATLYCPWFACTSCARAIIVAGIKRVVGHQRVMDKAPKRWMENIHTADEMLDEAGVMRVYYADNLFQSDPRYMILFDGGYWIP